MKKTFLLMTLLFLRGYHKASAEHLGYYVDEFAFRFGEDNRQWHTMDRLDSLFDRMVGKRLTYDMIRGQV